MKHCQAISRAPRTAASPLCTSPTSDFQVTMCFLLSILTDFFVPVLDIVKGTQDDNTTDGDTTA